MDQSRKNPPSDIALSVKCVSKRFKLYHDMITGPVKEILFFWRRTRYFKEHWAVKDLSLEVRRGEVVGIVGPNGAGKTTLLKMIAGLLPIDRGEIVCRGKVTALLALGAGFHPEFTGRENIFYGGLLLGMTREEILAKTESIIKFSELGDFIDRPFRTYSSGMKARLLFSTSMSIDPDILIIDEALATGDSYFVQKASRRIKEMCESGATILFVTHNLAQIEQLCDRAILISDGQLVSEGTPHDTVKRYHALVYEREMRAVPRSSDITSHSGDLVQIRNVRLFNESGDESKAFYSGEKLSIQIDYESFLPKGVKAHLFVGFLRKLDHEYVGEINTVNRVDPEMRNLNTNSLELDEVGRIWVRCEPTLLLNDHYSLWIILYENGRYFCDVKDIAPFFVARKNNVVLRDSAVFWQPARIQMEKL